MAIVLIIIIAIVLHMFNMKAEYGPVFTFLANYSENPLAYSPWKIAFHLYMPAIANYMSDPFINPSTPRWIETLIYEKGSDTTDPNNLNIWNLFGSNCNEGDDPNTCLTNLGLIDASGKPVTQVPPNWSTTPMRSIPGNSRIMTDYYNGQGFNLLSVVYGGFVSLSENNQNMSVAELYTYCFTSYPSKSGDKSTCTTAKKVGGFAKNIINYSALGIMIGMPEGGIGAVPGAIGGALLGSGLSLFQLFTDQLC